MAWFNQSIYGGDLPLKWRDRIYEICDNSIQYEIGVKGVFPIDPVVLSEKLSIIIDEIESQEDPDYKNIGFQVLGAVIVHSGFDLDSVSGLKDKIAKSLEEDFYAKESKSRSNVVLNFRNLLFEYNPENPINISNENFLKEPEDIRDELGKEFKLIYDLIKGRINKIKNSISESSGDKNFDDGYKTASEEEVDFLNDFVELLQKVQLAGELFQKIEENITESPIALGDA